VRIVGNEVRRPSPGRGHASTDGNDATQERAATQDRADGGTDSGGTTAADADGVVTG